MTGQQPGQDSPADLTAMVAAVSRLGDALAAAVNAQLAALARAFGLASGPGLAPSGSGVRADRGDPCGDTTPLPPPLTEP